MASADLVVNIVTKLSGDGMQQAEKSTSKFKSGLATASKVAGAALLGIGAAAIGAANAAAEDAKSQALLANSMKNAAGASKDQIAATEDWIDAQSRATGVADDELRPALGTLVRATGDVTKSQAALKQAMDISAATGKPLKSVTDAMAKGFSGNTSALSRLVPGISKAAQESGDFSRIMDEVAQKTGGAAAAAADTAAGKMARFKNSLGETQEAAGAVLLPALEKLTGILVPLGQWAQDHGTMFAIIAGGVAIFAAAIIALNVALSIYNTITAITAIVSTAAWAATLGPILLVVAAVALVVAAIVILWKKSETFRNIVLAVWRAIKVAAQAVGRFLVAMWNSVSAAAKRFASIARTVFGAVKSAAANVASAVKTVWRLVWSAISAYVRAYLAVIRVVASAIRIVISAVVSFIRDKWRAVWDAVGSMAEGFRDKMANIWEAIKSGAANLGSTISKPFDTIWGAIQRVIDAVESLIGALGRIHVPKISLPHIPGLSFAAPAVAADDSAARAAVAPAVASPRAGLGAGGRGATNINIYGAIDPEATARQVKRLLTNHQRRVGLRVV